jgi:tripartite-type tricarboxylate transporter receptor subunit TctC
MTQASTYTVLPITQEGKLAFDLHRDFVPIGLVGIGPIAIAVNASLGVNTLPELIALAKRTPGGLQFGAANRGGQSHLTGILLSQRAGVNLSFVHAQGAVTTLSDVIAGRIPIMMEGLSGIAPGLQGGGIKAIAIASEKRLVHLPDLPTVGESIPDFQSHGWIALMAPSGTPDHIVQKISADLRAVLELAEVRQKFEVLGQFIRILSPAETAAFIQSEEQLWWPIVRELERGSK